MQHTADVPALTDTARMQYRSLYLYLLFGAAAILVVAEVGNRFRAR